jgi:hypothetical protein
MRGSCGKLRERGLDRLQLGGRRLRGRIGTARALLEPTRGVLPLASTRPHAESAAHRKWHRLIGIHVQDATREPTVLGRREYGVVDLDERPDRIRRKRNGEQERIRMLARVGMRLQLVDALDER